MTLRTETLTATTTSGGTAIATTSRPINGYVVAVRNAGSWGTIAAGTADYTFTTAVGEGSGTVLSLSNQTDPFTAYVGGSIQGGGPSAAFLGVPVDGYLQMTVVQAAANASGTVVVYYDGER